MPSLPNADIKTQVFLWVGDNDQYLHKLAESVNVKTSGGSSAQTVEVTTTVGVTITFKGFDQPVTITAPANAESIDLSGLSGSDSSMVQGMAGGFISNPLTAGFGAMAGVSSVPSGPAPVATPPVVVGMPTTGSSSENALWLLVALGVVSISAGAIVRRRVIHAMRASQVTGDWC